MSVYYSIVVFIFGLVFGSFYNVVGYRLPNKMSIAFPSSFCPKCNHKLKWYELIPVISYIFLLGKCKKCKNKISIMYPLIELISAILFLVSFLLFGFSINFFIAIVFISALIIISISDLRYFIVPDEVLIFSIIIIILLYLINCIFNNLSLVDGFLFKILNAFLSFLSVYLFKILSDFLFKKESLGGGDVKLFFLIGLVVGFDMSFVVLFVASLIALPISTYSLIKDNNNMLPFGPYLSISSIIILFSSMNLNDVLNLFIK